MADGASCHFDEVRSWLEAASSRTPAEMAALNIEPAEFHGDWNYTISPNIYPPNCSFIS